jgi:hypothetical protein
MASNNHRNQPAPENVEHPSATTASKRTTETESDTPEGPARKRRKTASTFSPGLHGQLLPLICDDGKDNVSEGIKKLYVSLMQSFDYHNVVNALLIELALADYWRLSKGLDFEREMLSSSQRAYVFDRRGDMPVITRYVTVSRRNLDRSLQMLLQIDKESEEAGAFPSETEEPAPQASATPANEAPAAESPAPVVQSGEANAGNTDNVPDAPSSAGASVPLTSEAGADPMPLASMPTEGAAETPAGEAAGEKPEADLPAAA